MTELHTLSSGSSGNALLLSRGDTHILLDAGISCRRITAELAALGLRPEELDAILVTHTHTDHICGLTTLLKHCAAPVWATADACRQLAYRIAGVESRLCPLEVGRSRSLGSCTVLPFPTSHDAPGCCGYRFDEAGVLTDTGYVTEAAADALTGAELLVLEANHDVALLRSGPYPYYLKERILGEHGHLSNDAAAEFAVSMAEHGTAEIVLAHLSRENNTPETALAAVSAALTAAGLSPRLSVAPRSTASRCYRTEGAPCRG